MKTLKTIFVVALILAGTTFVVYAQIQISKAEKEKPTVEPNKGTINVDKLFSDKPVQQEIVVAPQAELQEAIKLEELSVNPVVEQPKLDKTMIVNTINEFSVRVGSPLSNSYGEVWYNLGLQYGIHPYVGVAIANADTGLGKQLSTPYNLGNVGNSDGCPACTAHDSWEHGIEAIFQTLRNKYLGNATKLCQLSVGGWNYCPEGRSINGGKFYASSPVNWQTNTNWTMKQLMPNYTNEFNYRL